MMSFKNIALFGAPGCGKGTQSALIKKEFNFYHLSTGDLLREIKSDTTSPFFEEINAKISSGELVGDDIIFKIVESKILEVSTKSHFQGIIFDGFPRNLNQAKFLILTLNKMNMNLDFAFIFNISFQSVIDRILNRFTCLKCGAVYNAKSKLPKISNVCDECEAQDSFSKRSDDTEEVIKNRLDIFNQNMDLIKDFFIDKCVEIDASLNTEEIFNNIKKTLAK